MKYLEQGFSLIEVLVVFVILTCGLVALGQLQGLSVSNRVISEQQAQAVQLAKSKLEELREYDTLTGATNSYASILSGNQTVTGLNTTYTLTWTVTENTTLNYKTVDVAAAWPAADNTTRTVTLSTHVARMNPAGSGTVIQAATGAGTIQPP